MGVKFPLFKSKIRIKNKYATFYGKHPTTEQLEQYDKLVKHIIDGFLNVREEFSDLISLYFKLNELGRFNDEIVIREFQIMKYQLDYILKDKTISNDVQDRL